MSMSFSENLVTKFSKSLITKDVSEVKLKKIREDFKKSSGKKLMRVFTIKESQFISSRKIIGLLNP